MHGWQRSTSNTGVSCVSFAAASGRPGTKLLLAAIEAYRLLLSPLLGGFCRFDPSCSRYAHEAVLRHGARRGAALALRRLIRCRPFGASGFDPVP